MQRPNRARPNERAQFDIVAAEGGEHFPDTAYAEWIVYDNDSDMEATVKNCVIFPDVIYFKASREHNATRFKCYQYFGKFVVRVMAPQVNGIANEVVKVAERFCSKGHNSITLPPMFVQRGQFIKLYITIYRVYTETTFVQNSPNPNYTYRELKYCEGLSNFANAEVAVGIGCKMDLYMGHDEGDN